MSRCWPQMTDVPLAGCCYAPWVNRKGEIVRSFRADRIAPLDPARKSA